MQKNFFLLIKKGHDQAPYKNSMFIIQKTVRIPHDSLI